MVFSNNGTPFELFVKHLSGAGTEESLGVAMPNAAATDVSLDAKWLTFSATDNKTALDLWLLPMTGERKPVPFLQSPALEGQGKFSPDGKWMAYVQSAGGTAQVLVQAISPQGTATGIQYRISASGGQTPSWRRDGKELVFTSGGKVIAVPITLGETVRAGTPQTLFEMPQGAVVFDMTRDGQRFLIGAPAGGAAQPNPLTVVLNWQAMLKK